jgi:hypothetical protein
MTPDPKQESRLLQLLTAGTIVVVMTILATSNLCACGRATGTFSSVMRTLGEAPPPAAEPVPAKPTSPEEPINLRVVVDDGTNCDGGR